MTPDEIRFRTDDGLSLVADAYGDDRAPCILFQHGGGQTRHAWKGTAEAVARAGWYALSLDLRGHGDSDWSPEGAYDLERYGHDTRAIAEQLGRAPVVVGASLGGVAGLLATTLSDPAPLGALVLVDVTPRMNPEGVQKIIGFMGENMEAGFESLEDAADAIARYLPHRPRPTNLEGLRKNLRETEDGRYRWHWDPKFVTSRQGSPSVLSKQNVLVDAARDLSIPTLLVRGRMSELVSEEHADEFRELVPHADYVDVSGAGHMVAGDRNDAFTEGVLAFLERLPGGGAIE